MGLGAGMDSYEKSRPPTGVRNMNHPARSLKLCRNVKIAGPGTALRAGKGKGKGHLITDHESPEGQ